MTPELSPIRVRPAMVLLTIPGPLDFAGGFTAREW